MEGYCCSAFAPIWLANRQQVGMLTAIFRLGITIRPPLITEAQFINKNGLCLLK